MTEDEFNRWPKCAVPACQLKRKYVLNEPWLVFTNESEPRRHAPAPARAWRVWGQPKTIALLKNRH